MSDAVSEYVTDLMGEVAAAIDGWASISPGAVHGVARYQAAHVLATWAAVRRLDACHRAPLELVARLDRVVANDAPRLAALAVQALDPSGWLESCAQLSRCVDDAVDQADADELGHQLFDDLDRAQLVAYAVGEAGGSVADLAPRIARCEGEVFADAGRFVGAADLAREIDATAGAAQPEGLAVTLDKCAVIDVAASRVPADVAPPFTVGQLLEAAGGRRHEVRPRPTLAPGDGPVVPDAIRRKLRLTPLQSVRWNAPIGLPARHVGRGIMRPADLTAQARDSLASGELQVVIKLDAGSILSDGHLLLINIHGVIPLDGPFVSLSECPGLWIAQSEMGWASYTSANQCCIITVSGMGCSIGSVTVSVTPSTDSKDVTDER